MIALRLVAALASGLLFGLGLSLSGMLDPARVRGFLDVTGAWDPGLAFVLAGAVAAAGLGTLARRHLARPVLAERFELPAKSAIDGRLVAGSALFGIGWGMAGLCPGPAVASLVLGLAPTAVFVAAMLAGMLIHGQMAKRAGGRAGG